MAKQTDVIVDDSQTVTTPEPEPTIIINNREVKISDAPEALKQMEHDIKSGFDKKLADERDAINDKLEYDINWYSTHDKKFWGNYNPTVDGGNGYRGDAGMLTEITPNGGYDTVEPASQIKPNAFQSDPKMKALENKLSKLESIIANLQETNYRKGINEVITIRKGLEKKYPNADIISVNALLDSYFDVNKVHPSAAVIEKIMKERSQFVLDCHNRMTLVKPVEPQKTTTTPAGGGIPQAPKKPMHELGSDAMLKDIVAQLEQG